MINEVVSGVCKKIREEFGDEYGIFTQQTEQAVKPCFYVFVTNEEITPILGKRYNWQHTIGVTYLPGDEADSREEINNVAFRLMDILEYIDWDGPIRGSEISAKVVYKETVFLEVSVRYAYTVYKQSDEYYMMNKLKQITGARR